MKSCGRAIRCWNKIKIPGFRCGAGDFFIKRYRRRNLEQTIPKDCRTAERDGNMRVLMLEPGQDARVEEIPSDPVQLNDLRPGGDHSAP